MNTFIESEKIRDFMERPFFNEFKVIVHGPKGVFGPHFNLIKDQKNSFRVGNILKGLKILCNFTLNKNEDKMEISISPVSLMHKDLADRFMFTKDAPNETIYSNDWTRRLMLRVVVISGFAYCGIMAGSRVAGYNKNQQPKNRKFWVNHKEIFKLLHPRMQFSGDSKKDFEKAFKVLWFHFPDELTGKDNDILRITLEEGLLDKPFS